MSLFDQIQNEPIQNRQINISSHVYDEHHILVCGELHDRRLVTTYYFDGRRREADSVHRMRICMKIDTDTLTITELDTEMPCTPHSQCHETQQSLKAIVGSRLVPGFSAQVHKHVGGPKGCIHLTTLLLAMAPAALQGYWTQTDRDPKGRRVSKEHLDRYLVNSCYVWRKDGDLIKKVTHHGEADAETSS